MLASAGALVAAFLWMTPVQIGDVTARLEAPVPEAPVEGAEPRSAAREFSGTWEYNPERSVNAATGRPETTRATQDRLGIGRGLATTGAPRQTDVFSGASAVRAGLYSLYLARRGTRRDLMEIAPTLRLEVTAERMTVTDDLDRVLTFPVDGSKQKYQLGAALFDARAAWQDGQLRIDIEGPDGLKMTESWFVSEDGSHLYLIIRVGDPVRDGRPVGVNRVYDRVQ